MKFDSVIIGGGLAGLTAGILLQSKGQKTAIVSSGQSALHFFSGTFETIQELPRELADVFSGAGIRVHSEEGVRLMPMGTFRDAALSLEDIGIFPDKKIGKKILIVNITGYHDFFAGFLADGLEKEGAQCRVRFVRLPELDSLRQSPSEMRSVQIARVLDAAWEKFAREVRLLLNDDDTVILPQVFGLADASIPGKLREATPANLVFAGTLPPSVPGVRTQMQLKRRYQVLGGTFLMGDTVLEAHVHDGVVHSVVTKNLEHNYLEADIFILASGGYFSKGLVATPSALTYSRNRTGTHGTRPHSKRTSHT